MGDFHIIPQEEKGEQERTTINKKALIEAMQKSLGVVTQACKIAGVDRGTYYNYYDSDPAFKKACDDCSEIALDFAESKLYKQIEDGVPVSTIFFLKTKGKNRGYIERSEQDITTGGRPIHIIELHDRTSDNTLQLPEGSSQISAEATGSGENDRTV